MRLVRPVFAILILTALGRGADRPQALPEASALVARIEDYAAKMRQLVPHYEARVREAAAKLESWKSLQSQGLASRGEIEGGERARDEAEKQLSEMRAGIADADRMLAEARLPLDAPAELASTVLRFDGKPGYSPSSNKKVEKFFSSRFGYPLPVSARGQTQLHNRLGFDHRAALDVALHPDSPEGEALLGYLREVGIPFIAFRSAVAGSATGAHIHVGRPSGRLPTAS